MRVTICEYCNPTYLEDMINGEMKRIQKHYGRIVDVKVSPFVDSVGDIHYTVVIMWEGSSDLDL